MAFPRLSIVCPLSSRRLQAREQQRVDGGECVPWNVVELGPPTIDQCAVMRNVAEPTARLVQRLEDGDGAAVKGIDNRARRRNDDVPRDPIILIGPVREVQSSLGIRHGENPWAIEFIEDFDRVE
ncbi:MAG: hypothetical protein WD069_08515 [Planctomycetales bacterium]